MKSFDHTVVRIVMAGVLTAVAGTTAAQQSYPSKPIRFMTPFVPGGTTTILARLVGQKLTESWGQQVVVDNRPGGNTVIGTEALAKSAPDGYTILLTGSSHTLIPQLQTVSYDPIKDFAPVATLAKTETVLVINASVPANNLQEFIALAKSKPGQLNYATPSTGGPLHLATEMFNIMAGTKMQHIAYKGAGQGLIDLIGGQVQLYFITSAAYVPHSKNGKLRAIATTGETRMAALPAVPTFAEAGLPGFDMRTWFGVLAPAGTPKAIIDKLATEIARYLTQPDFKEKLISQGADPFVLTPEQYAALMKADMAKFAKVIKTANIKLD